MSMHKVFYKMGYKAMDRHNIRLKYRVMNVPPTEHSLTISVNLSEEICRNERPEQIWGK